MNPILDLVANTLAKKYREFFSGVDIDFEKQIVYWRPKDLKFNIFEILGTVMDMLRIKFIGDPAKIDEEVFALPFYKRLSNNPEEMIILTPSAYHHIIKNIHEFILERFISNTIPYEVIEIYEIKIHIRKPYYTVIVDGYLTLGYINNKLILYTPEKVSDLLECISSIVMS